MYFSGYTVFRRYSSLKHMPLYKNVQTELYAKDVLSLDADYSEEQAKHTKSQIKEWTARQKYSHSAAIWLHAYGAGTLAKALGMVVFYAAVYPIILLGKIFNKVKEQALRKAAKEASESRAKSMSELLSFIAAKKLKRTLTAREHRGHSLTPGASVPFERSSVGWIRLFEPSLT